MADPASGSGPRGRVGAGLLAVILVMLLALIVVALLVPTPWLEQVGRLEAQWSRQALGERTAAAVLEQARQWSRQALDRERWAASAAALGEVQASAWMDGIDPTWLSDRLDAFWRLVALALLRAALLMAWGPPLLLLLLAGVLDGHWRWRIRQLGFDYPSPVARQASQTGLTLVVALLLLALLLPVPLHPWLIPLLALVAAMLIGTGITHLPKQL